MACYAAPPLNWTRVCQLWGRRKSLNGVSDSVTSGNSALRRSLTAVDLILYGVGSSVGAGIYVLVGMGAQTAGPAIALSFAGCGAACMLTSLCYADFAARIPITGSAFTYAYVALNELTAWLVGWNLTLGYGFTTSVVARAWADYVGSVLREALAHPGNDDDDDGISNRWILLSESQRSWLDTTLRYMTDLPVSFPSSTDDQDSEETGYTCSPLALLLVVGGTLILLQGAKESSQFNNVMTILNLLVLVLVIVSGLGSVRADNFVPFAPSGMEGVVAGAGLVFFAFIGFDMVASLSEEVVNPQRNMPIGIVGSLVVSTCLYVAVAAVVVGMTPIALLAETNVPIVHALLVNAGCTHAQQVTLPDAAQLCLLDCLSLSSSAAAEGLSCYSVQPWLAVVGRIVGLGAILGLTASCFTSLMGQPRILYSLAREGLLPAPFAAVHEATQVPHVSILITGIVTALLACFAPMESLANLISLGTLLVFTVVNVGVLVLRLQNQTPAEAEEAVSDLFFSPPNESSSLLHCTHQNNRTPTAHVRDLVLRWILVFSFGTLCASLLFSHPSKGYPQLSAFLAWCFLLTSAIAALIVVYLPPSSAWFPRSGSHCGSHEKKIVAEARDDAVFSCPLVPGVPLAGIACNTFMMGSLPLQAWAWCAIWMLAGFALYLSYGMHRAVVSGEQQPRPTQSQGL